MRSQPLFIRSEEEMMALSDVATQSAPSNVDENTMEEGHVTDYIPNLGQRPTTGVNRQSERVQHLTLAGLSPFPWLSALLRRPHRRA